MGLGAQMPGAMAPQGAPRAPPLWGSRLRRPLRAAGPAGHLLGPGRLTPAPATVGSGPSHTRRREAGGLPGPAHWCTRFPVPTAFLLRRNALSLYPSASVHTSGDMCVCMCVTFGVWCRRVCVCVCALVAVVSPHMLGAERRGSSTNQVVTQHIPSLAPERCPRVQGRDQTDRG